MPRHAPVPLDQVDLADLDGFANLRGFSQLDTLRAEDPVHWNPEPDGKGFWAVTKYNDIWEVDKAPEKFTSEKFVNLEDVDDDLMDFRRSILETDGTRHAALRRLVQREFTPRNLMKNYEAFLKALTKETVDRAFATARDNDGVFDYVKMISADFPIQVLARLLDVPLDKTPQLIAWGNEMVANTDPDYAKVRLDLAESEKYRHLPFRSPTVQDVWDYGNELKSERIGGEGVDLVSILANTLPADGIPLSQQDFNNYFSLLVIAGNETTRHSISNTMIALIENQDQLRLLQEKPEMIEPAVEEFLRWASPVYHFRRTAVEDTELGGKEIKAGDKVVMWFPSGNRDDDIFDDPYTFDVTRTNVDHMTFGKGSPHLCLGNNLARMEIRLMYQELIPRLASVDFAGDVTRVRSNFVNGVKKFPIKVSENA
ncbi:MAG: cytochrome P450 [Phycicoccus sp.]|nr:cytochrome P450 [Phycicoccus sp.]